MGRLMIRNSEYVGGRQTLLAPPARNHRLMFWLNVLLVAAFGFAVTGAIALVAAYKVLSIGLPHLESLADYRPNLVTEVYDRRGLLIGEFKFENQSRYLIKVTQVPDHVIKAVIAAEDQDFYTHQGLDYMGILRAAWTNLWAGEIKQGASTITQQVTKSLLLSPEKTYARKMREIILAKRIEDRFTKKDILYLYLNQIYFGSGAYGIEAAAKEYFGKDAGQLTVAEGALLAGLIQAPSHYHPRTQPEQARARRHYVLNRMAEDGYISRAQLAQFDGQPLGVVPHYELNLALAPDFVEYIRRYLMDHYGAERSLKDGLKITTTCDYKLQQRAASALRAGLQAHARRQGRLALPDTILAEQWEAWRNRLAVENKNAARGQSHEGLVTALDDAAGKIKVDLGDQTVWLPISQLQWVTSVERQGKLTAVKNVHPGSMLRLGDRVLVNHAADSHTLAPWPAAQGALVALDLSSREVLAMIGGNDFTSSQFNRAIQAKRQPGSAFKPIVYAAALNAGLTPATVFPDTALVFADNWRPSNYDHHFRGYVNLRQALTKSINTVTIRVAQLISVDYLLRFARRVGLKSLTHGDLSMAIGTYEVPPIELMNAYAVFATGGRLAEPLFIKKIADRDGKVLEETKISQMVEPLPPLENVPNLRNMNAQELAKVAPPVEDPLVLSRRAEFFSDFDLGPKPQPASKPDVPSEPVPTSGRAAGAIVWKQVLDPQVAYVITNMMHSVATEGTGARSNVLKRVVAGKTGTTSEYVDAWFIGFSPQILAGVWVGNDRGANSLGSGESGSVTALPIWIDFMQTALANQPNVPFPVPPGVVFARVDPETGFLAPPDSPGEEEVFVAGTEPTQIAPKSAAPGLSDFLNLEYQGD